VISIGVEKVNLLDNDVVGNGGDEVVCNGDEVEPEVWTVTVTVCMHDPAISSNG
jgi:hypothetical protein